MSDVIDQLIQAEVEFWQRVQDRNPPPPSTLNDRKTLYPTSNGEAIQADSATIGVVDQLNQIKESIKQLQDEENTLKAKVMDSLGEAEILTSDTGKTIATWKSITSNRLDTKKLKAEQPEIAKEYTHTSTYRTLRIK